jgi:CheY-like chemotaxis protein
MLKRLPSIDNARTLPLSTPGPVLDHNSTNDNFHFNEKGITISAVSPHQPTRILFIEDHEADVRLAREALDECHAGPFEIVTVADGEEAIGLLKRQADFDLILLDLNLPRMDGFQVLEQSRTSVPIIVFSSSWNESDSKRALALGAREFVRKPTTYNEYVDTLCAIISRFRQKKLAE